MTTPPIAPHVWPIHPTRTDAVTFLHTKGTEGTHAITLAWAAEPPVVPDGADAKTVNALPWRMVYACFIGTQAKCKQIRANWRLRSSERSLIIHRAPTDDLTVRVPLTRAGAERNVYTSFAAPIADAYPFLQLVEIHQAVLQPRCGEVFYHIAPASGGPDLEFFGQQLGQALVLPLPLEHLAAIWDAGVAATLITPLRSWGCQGYRIDTGNLHAWAEAINTVTGGSGTLTVIGGPPTLDLMDPDGAADAETETDDDSDDD